MADKNGFPRIMGYRYVKKHSYTKPGKTYPALVIELECVDGGTLPVTCLIRWNDFRILGVTDDMFPVENKERG